MLSGLSLLLSLPCGGLRWPGQAGLAGLARAYVLHGMLTEGERASAFLGPRAQQQSVAAAVM